MTSNHRPLEEGDIELIDRIRATPSLYDSRDPDFRLVYKKDQQWQAIADGLSMTHFEARKRWTVLRDRYARELKQLLMHPDSMEYGKNEFFHRMDFLRNFVKKRRVRKKCYDDADEEMEEKPKPLKITKFNSSINNFEIYHHNEEKPKPLKITKVDSNINNFEIYHHNPDQDDQKTYIIDDSQESFTRSDSYMEQISQVHHQQHEEQLNNPIIEDVEDQQYQEYVEDVSESYDAVVMDPDNQHHQDSSNHSSVAATVSRVVGVQLKPEIITPTFTANYSITTISKGNAASLPHLQQKPVGEASYSDSTITNSSEQNDIEDYFSKTIASYLKQLSRRYKIKAKVEMMQILEKYIDLEEMEKKSKF